MDRGRKGDPLQKYNLLNPNEEKVDHAWMLKSEMCGRNQVYQVDQCVYLLF
jgi:hypothetical protein